MQNATTRGSECNPTIPQGQLFTTTAGALERSLVLPADVELVWAYYAEWHPQTRLDAKRRRCIQQRLAEGYTVAQLQTAIRGCHTDAWYMGDNDRGKSYCDLCLILRDSDHVDKFISLATNPRTPSRASGRDVTRMAGGNVDTLAAARRLVTQAAAR